MPASKVSGFSGATLGYNIISSNLCALKKIFLLSKAPAQPPLIPQQKYQEFYGAIKSDVDLGLKPIDDLKNAPSYDDWFKSKAKLY